MRIAASDQFDNRLIFGDNLLALKALEQEFTGRVRCIFIDPPYNTGSAFEHYDDGVEHSLWLSTMRDRLNILRGLLSPDGSLWMSVDDNEAHYAKVLCDEIFGRQQFVANVLWQKRTSPEQRLPLGAAHDHVLVYARAQSTFRLNRLPPSDRTRSAARNPDEDPRGPWTSTDFTAQGYRPNQMYEIVTPGGERLRPPPGRCWSYTEPEFERLRDEKRIWFGVNGSSRPRIKTFVSESEGIAAWTWWPHSEVGSNQEAKKESNELFGAAGAFATPKPERLLQRILMLATSPGDLVLDSFAGSGTTGAVAHKMGRRWIMVELGEHCHTHIVPRLTKVVDGDDHGGITASAGWRGGGGFRFYRLAPSLLERDRWGNWVISREFNAAMLAEAVCKIEGFRYEPSAETYWIHGRSSEHDFCWATTQELTASQLQSLSDDVGTGRTLLVCCGAWIGDETAWPNLTLKKIPNAVLARCEFGRDDYSLAIADLPKADLTEQGPARDEMTAPPRHAGKRAVRSGGSRKNDRDALDLLDES
jgi:adenine-specific DNA-methyltransferase